MRITVSRTGGFAGIRPPPIVLDTATLAGAAKKRVEQLVTACDFFDLPATLTASEKSADQFLHHITIADDGGREHSVTLHADAASEPLRDLIHLVRSGA
jgi:hypothetical protein